jgi:hypothetical protein
MRLTIAVHQDIILRRLKLQRKMWAKKVAKFQFLIVKKVNETNTENETSRLEELKKQLK